MLLLFVSPRKFQPNIKFARVVKREENLIILSKIGYRFIDLSKKLWLFLTVDLAKEIAKKKKLKKKNKSRI